MQLAVPSFVSVNGAELVLHLLFRNVAGDPLLLQVLAWVMNTINYAVSATQRARACMVKSAARQVTLCCVSSVEWLL